MWNFGSLAGLSLVIMIVTGIVLAMSYTAHVDYAFESVERIMRDVNHGWLIRYIHEHGEFLLHRRLSSHFRGLYYGSKAPRELLDFGGCYIFADDGDGFHGHVLPWGQMSFWGATVITSLFSAIPLVGESIVTFLWGGFQLIINLKPVFLTALSDAVSDCWRRCAAYCGVAPFRIEQPDWH